MKLEQIKASLEADVREPTREICLRLLHELAKRQPDQLQRLTYMLLAKMVETPIEDSTFQTALSVLTNHRHHPLTMYYVFYDEEDGREIPLSAKEVIASVDEDEFVHPRTGEVVMNYQRLIRPVFRASKEFAASLANDDY